MVNVSTTVRVRRSFHSTFKIPPLPELLLLLLLEDADVHVKDKRPRLGSGVTKYLPFYITSYIILYIYNISIDIIQKFNFHDHHHHMLKQNKV